MLATDRPQDARSDHPAPTELAQDRGPRKGQLRGANRTLALQTGAELVDRVAWGSPLVAAEIAAQGTDTPRTSKKITLPST
jgi:hypothetical protein